MQKFAAVKVDRSVDAVARGRQKVHHPAEAIAGKPFGRAI